MHAWRLKQAINELDEVTFTGKHDDNPKLKGGQKDLPDEIQSKIVAKEGEDYEEFDDDDFAEFSYLADTYENAEIIADYIESELDIETDIDNVTGPAPFYITLFDINSRQMPSVRKKINRMVSNKPLMRFDDEQIQKIIALNSSKPKLKKEGEDKRDFEVDDIVKVKATGKKGKVVDMSPSETFFIVNVGGKNSSFHGSDLILIKRSSLNEAGDHEVGMAQASLKSIVGAASELISKIGDQEFDIPGWIQDHITNAENYISQANKGYHKLDNEYED